MSKKLETVVEKGCLPDFKSKGERQIGRFLDSNLIKYRYESPILVRGSKGEHRIWYPDFHLTEFEIYIEYYGLAGRPEYDKGIRVKESVYAANHMDVIAIYPWMFSESWKGYLLTEIGRSLRDRLRGFQSKLYRSRQGAGASGMR